MTRFSGVIAITFLASFLNVAQAQLQITEIQASSLSPEPQWEWVEVRNTGATPLDLNGYVFDDDDGQIVNDANISNANGTTIIPAGGVGVLYNGSSFSFDPQLYRDAWQLGPSVPMIPVSTSTGLNNGGDHIGVWPSYSEYLTDSVDDGTKMGISIVGGFGAAVTNFNFEEIKTGSGEGVSQHWNGSGSATNPLNWLPSEIGQSGVVESTRIEVVDAVNSIEDVGNPGVVPTGLGTGLVISEVMFNPRSGEPTWEWVEVVNNTGSNIDFGATGHYLDDIASAALGAPNITSGSIADGEVAILFNDSLTEADFLTAWGSSLNAIPVSEWSSLNNGNSGDTFGIWNNESDYLADDRANGDFDGAEVSVAYDGMLDDGFGSIYDDGSGTFLLSALMDAIGSTNASPVGGVVVEHEGGDVGSPGSFGMSETLVGDYDGSGQVSAGDLNLVLNNWGQDGTTPPDGWVNDFPIGIISAEELNRVLNGWGDSAIVAVPEPSAFALVLLGLLAFRRRH